MPGLVVPMNPLCDVTFVAQKKGLPLKWLQPMGVAAKHYTDAFKLSELAAIPEPMCYYWTATVNKYHVDTCKDIGKKFKDFAHKALDETKKAFDQWRSQAKFKDLKVMAVCAIGAPGCLDAPKLKDCYMGWEGEGDNEKKYVKAVKEGISECLEEWSSKVTVPGLPWYPAFAAYPGPTTPPTPNIPMPLIIMPSPGLAKMTPKMLGDAMTGKLDSGVKKKDKDKQHEALFLSIGTAFAAAFMAWLPMQMAMNVLGKGPVPVFAPPYVPVGPVVAGDNIAVPGHLAT